jgi:hypothetical protein
MATREQVRCFQTQQPFRPFQVRTNGGNTFTVRHPELVSCSVNGRDMFLHDEQGLHVLEMFLIEELTPTTPEAAKPAGNGDA